MFEGFHRQRGFSDVISDPDILETLSMDEMPKQLETGRYNSVVFSRA